MNPDKSPQVNTYADIGDRIRLLRAKRSRDEFAVALAVSRNTLMRYEQGQRRPDSEFLQRLCMSEQVDPAWLLLGKSESPSISSDLTDQTLSGEFALLPLYNVEVSAGFGAAIDHEYPATRLAFRRDWLQKMGLYADKVLTLLASGDSMEPSIRAGDVLMVDRAQQRLVKDAIYIIRQNNLLYVKRVQRLYDGSVRISSDNKAYAEEVIPRTDLDCLEIVGRVVWSAGPL